MKYLTHAPHTHHTFGVRWIRPIVCLTLLMAVVSHSKGSNAEQHDWENQYMLSANRLPARASYVPYLHQPGDRTMSLDGAWRFHWTTTPDAQPADFYKVGHDDSAWDHIAVPGDWEMNGYGTPIYSSSGYTFKIQPPFVMKEPKNSIIKQYEALLKMDNVQLDFTESALRAIARKTIERKSGARGLRSVMENILIPVMYTIPSDPTIIRVIVDEDTVNGGKPHLEYGAVRKRYQNQVNTI